MKHFRYDLTPTPRQATALRSEAFALLYGGALGGGKTEYLLQCVSLYSEQYPGCRMGFLRRNYKELMQSGGPLDRAESLWSDQPGVRHRKTDKVFIAPNGSRVEFRHCEKAGDEKHLQGSEYDVLLIDEAALFHPEALNYFIERIRGKKINRYRLSSNPGGPGHDWLNGNFRLNATPGFEFVPAAVADNPHLPEHYFERLDATMSGIDKRHRLMGEWDAVDDTGFFIAPPVAADIPTEFTSIVRAWDLALGGDNTVGTLVGKTRGPQYWVLDQIVQKTPAHQLLTLIRETHEMEPDVQVVMEQEPGASSAALIDSLPFAKGVRADRNKQARAAITARHIRDGKVMLQAGSWVQPLLNEMTVFPNGANDDRVDSLVYAINYLASGEVMLWGF